jgi:hypothetical protein
MKCKECGHKMEVHYTIFCPKCDTDVLKRKPMVVGDLFKIMYHMEANGYMSKDSVWRHFNVPGNDCYIDLCLEADEGSELHEYYSKIAELLGVNYGDEVVMWVSW